MAGPRNVQEVLDGRVGVRTKHRRNFIAATVGAAAADLLGSEPSRLAFFVINLSLNRIFITPDGTASTSNGILLGANGGSLNVLWEEDGAIVGYSWNAIADAAGSAVLVVETLIADPFELVA